MDPTPVEEDDDDPGDDLKEPNIMQTIKDAVHKVVNVFRPKNVTLALQTNGSQLAGASLRSLNSFPFLAISWRFYIDLLIHRHGLLPPGLPQERKQVVTYLLATQKEVLHSYSTTAGLWRLLPLLCPGLGVPLTPLLPPPSGLPWTWLAFLRAAHGDDLILALCNLHSIDQGLSPIRDGVEESSNATQVQYTTLIHAPSTNLDDMSTTHIPGGRHQQNYRSIIIPNG